MTVVRSVALNGDSLTIEQLVQIARENARVELDPSTNERVAQSEALIARVVENYRRAYEQGQAAPTEYGVTTGFGEFKDKPIAPEDLEQLQRNLLLSHSVGVGENSDPDDLTNYYPAEVVRGALATRVNGNGYDLYDDARSQVYSGKSSEERSTNNAVEATEGEVIKSNGGVL